MELTFLKLAGSPAPAERGASTRTEGKRAEARGRWRSKKDRSAGASSVDGGNGSLGIALSISGPLGPSATPLPPYGHYRRLHSIPFHPFSLHWNHPRNSPNHPPFPMLGKTPRQTWGFRQCCRASPVPTSTPGAWRSLYSLRCICMTPTHLNRRLFTANSLSLFLSLPIPPSFSQHPYCVLYFNRSFLVSNCTVFLRFVKYPWSRLPLESANGFVLLLLPFFFTLRELLAARNEAPKVFVISY